MEQIEDFKLQIHEGRAAITMDLMAFLTDWLKHHFLETDALYVPLLNEKMDS